MRLRTVFCLPFSFKFPSSSFSHINKFQWLCDIKFVIKIEQLWWQSAPTTQINSAHLNHLYIFIGVKQAAFDRIMPKLVSCAVLLIRLCCSHVNNWTNLSFCDFLQIFLIVSLKLVRFYTFNISDVTSVTLNALEKSLFYFAHSFWKNGHFVVSCQILMKDLTQFTGASFRVSADAITDRAVQVFFLLVFVLIKFVWIHSITSKHKRKVSS